MADDLWSYQIMLQVSHKLGKRSWKKGQNEKEKWKKVVAETLNINLSELQYLPGKVLDCVVPSRHPVTQIALKVRISNKLDSVHYTNCSIQNSLVDSDSVQL